MRFRGEFKIFLGGGAPLRNDLILVSCLFACFFFLFSSFQNATYFRNPHVISREGKGGAQPLHFSPRSAPALVSSLSPHCAYCSLSNYTFAAHYKHIRYSMMIPPRFRLVMWAKLPTAKLV